MLSHFRQGRQEQAQTEAQTTENGEVIVIRTTEKELKEIENRIATEITKLNKVPKSISRFSMMAGIFQFVQAFALFIVASNREKQWNVYTFYPVPSSNFTIPGVVPEPQLILTMNIYWYAPVFILLSGLEHFSCLFFRDTYEWYVARNQNPFRWTEYTFSASIVHVMLAQLAGVTDVYTIIGMFFLTAIMIQWGACFEEVNAKAHSENRKKQWRSFWMSWITHLWTWVIIFAYFTARLKNTNDNESGILMTVMILLFLIDASFGIVFWLQWAKIGIFEDYVVGEKAYIVLSFTAKTSIARLSVGLQTN